ncbi:MAG: FIST C-terminal domain-containing protein [Proteobacteria bacterium]|nr:FIST C-terminal domain-containing protein [Pseudomonadota bacterium]
MNLYKISHQDITGLQPKNMGAYIETGVGKAHTGKDADMGRKAAVEALTRLNRFKPTLTIVFASSELNIEEVSRGVTEIVGDCPIIGTSTAGEIADGYLSRSVVVAVIASPHLRIRTGIGRHVSFDYKKAVRQALAEAGVSGYFSPDHPLHQMLNMTTSRGAGVSPVFLIVFSPGATKKQASFSHDIHTELRKASVNRIPIFGGSSSDNYHFESNYQIMNDVVYNDAIALAFIETDILFGLGTAHGFSPTTQRALVTRASGHIVHELDGRPAVDVCADLLGIPIEHLGDGVIWFSQFPFGTSDLYGNWLLNVPECVLPDGSIQFGPLMRNDQVLTLMRANREDIVRAGLAAYNKAIRQGGLKKPAFAMMFSCALRKRLMGSDESKEMDLLRKKARIPLCGFYTFGEQGLSDDGLPVFQNQSVSTLVFSDELNPVTALIHKGKRIYYEFTSRLNKKETQMKVMSKINRIIQEETDMMRLIARLSDRLNNLFPWADWKFYLPADIRHTFSIATTHDNNGFPTQIYTKNIPSGFIFIPLDSQSKRFGVLLLKGKTGIVSPDEEDMTLAKTIARLTAKGLQRIEVDKRLTNKLVQLEILNHLSNEISRSITTNTKLKNITRHIRRILKLSTVSLWLIDPAGKFLVKDASDADRTSKEIYDENDEGLARWQIEHRRPVSIADLPKDDFPVKMSALSDRGFISLPISYKGQIMGILNLFWKKDHELFFQYDHIQENMEFLSGVTNQLAIFIENRYLQKHTTFLKEIHHRVKNNLQNVASILRMQIRRLDGSSAEQALNDSISRIMSIAVVHETLCQGEIGMVDLRKLMDNVSRLSLAGQFEPKMAVDISGPSMMIPSKEATSLALILNELIQNAARHAYKGQSEGKLSIILEEAANNVSVTIKDEGSGLPEGFNPDKDGNLGLTIVRTLVKDDLRGRFTLGGEGRTTACVTFPLMKNYYDLKL